MSIKHDNHWIHVNLDHSIRKEHVTGVKIDSRQDNLHILYVYLTSGTMQRISQHRDRCDADKAKKELQEAIASDIIKDIVPTTVGWECDTFTAGTEPAFIDTGYNWIDTQEEGADVHKLQAPIQATASFVIRQIQGGKTKGQYQIVSDDEVMVKGDEKLRFQSLDEAKKHIEALYDAVMAEEMPY